MKRRAANAKGKDVRSGWIKMQMVVGVTVTYVLALFVSLPVGVERRIGNGGLAPRSMNTFSGETWGSPRQHNESFSGKIMDDVTMALQVNLNTTKEFPLLASLGRRAESTGLSEDRSRHHQREGSKADVPEEVLQARDLLVRLATDGSKAVMTSNETAIIDSYSRTFTFHWAKMLSKELNDKKRKKRDWASFPYWPTVFVMGTAKTSSTYTWRLVTGASTLCGGCCFAGVKTALKMCGTKTCKELWPAAKSHRSYLKHFGANPKCHVIAVDAVINGSAPFIAPAGVWKSGMPYQYVDGTPMLSVWGAADRLKAMLPPHLRSKVKFVALIREPVSRALSAFNHEHRNSSMSGLKNTSTSVHRFAEIMDEQMKKPLFSGEVADYVASGLYFRHLSAWFKAFSREQFLIVEYADLVKGDTAAHLRRIAAFLGVGAEGMVKAYRDEKKQRLSLLKPLEMGDLPCEQVQKYSDYFAPHNEDLYELLKSTKGYAPEKQSSIMFPDPMEVCGGAGLRGSLSRKEAEKLPGPSREQRLKGIMMPIRKNLEVTPMAVPD